MNLLHNLCISHAIHVSIVAPAIRLDKNFLPRLQDWFWRTVWGSDGQGGQKCRWMGAQWEGLKLVTINSTKISPLFSLSSTRVRARRATTREVNLHRQEVTSNRALLAPTMSRPDLTVSPIWADGVLVWQRTHIPNVEWIGVKYYAKGIIFFHFSSVSKHDQFQGPVWGDGKAKRGGGSGEGGGGEEEEGGEGPEGQGGVVQGMY